MSVARPFKGVHIGPVPHVAPKRPLDVRIWQWPLRPSVAYWMGSLLASIIGLAIIVAVLRP